MNGEDLKPALVHTRELRKWHRTLSLTLLLVIGIAGSLFAYRACLNFLDSHGIVDFDHAIHAPIDLQILRVVRDAALPCSAFEVHDGKMLPPNGCRFLGEGLHLKPETGAWLVVYTRIIPHTDMPNLDSIRLLEGNQEAASLSGLACPGYADISTFDLQDELSRLCQEKPTQVIGLVFHFSSPQSLPSGNLKVRIQWKNPQGEAKSKRFLVSSPTVTLRSDDSPLPIHITQEGWILDETCALKLADSPYIRTTEEGTRIFAGSVTLLSKGNDKRVFTIQATDKSLSDETQSNFSGVIRRQILQLLADRIPLKKSLGVQTDDGRFFLGGGDDGMTVGVDVVTQEVKQGTRIMPPQNAMVTIQYPEE